MPGRVCWDTVRSASGWHAHGCGCGCSLPEPVCYQRFNPCVTHTQPHTHLRHPPTPPKKPGSFLEEAEGKITPESAAAVRDMIARLHAKSDVRTAALQTMDILELALPPAEMWAIAAANADGAPPLDFHDCLSDDFVDRMRDHIAPC